MTVQPAGGPPGRRWWFVPARVAQRATVNFVEDRATHHAAAISYFALLALFPLVLLAVSAFGLVLRDETRRADVIDALIDELPVEDGSIRDALDAVIESGPTVGVIALVGALWTSAALVSALRRAFSDAFDVDDPHPAIRGKLVDLTVLPTLGLLVLGSFVLTTAWRVIEAQFADRFDFIFHTSFSWAWDLGALAIPLTMSFVAFLLLYRILPNRDVQLRHLWPGAVVAAIGYEFAKLGFSIYLAHFANYDVVYGSLAGVIALLIWIYVAANILLFGAEVAAEVPHVLAGEGRHGRAAATSDDWRRSLRLMLRGLLFTPGDGERSPRSRAPSGRDRP